MGRKARGMRTQAALAERWRRLGLFPYATDQGPGRSGNDLINTPGIAVEIKAREQCSLPAALRQASNSAGPDTPIVVWRHNGQGEGAIGEWTVTMSLIDFENWVLERQCHEQDGLH